MIGTDTVLYYSFYSPVCDGRELRNEERGCLRGCTVCLCKHKCMHVFMRERECVCVCMICVSVVYDV